MLWLVPLYHGWRIKSHMIFSSHFKCFGWSHYIMGKESKATWNVHPTLNALVGPFLETLQSCCDWCPQVLQPCQNRGPLLPLHVPGKGSRIWTIIIHLEGQILLDGLQRFFPHGFFAHDWKRSRSSKSYWSRAPNYLQMFDMIFWSTLRQDKLKRNSTLKQKGM